MAKGIDRLLLGGAFVVGGLLHHRVGQVGTRVSSIEQSVQDQAEQAAQAPPAGMPLPTGYGLQVRGPAGEDILIPVCLPPGFELDSMVLRPAFLPSEHRRAPVHVEQPAQPAPAPAPAAQPAPPAEPDRLAAALQLVYSEPASYLAQTEGVSSPGQRMVEAVERLDRLDRMDRLERLERDLSVL
jgi:hypothetical protein